MDPSGTQKKWGETNPPFTEDDFMKKTPFLFRGFPISLTGGYSKRLAQKWLVSSKHPFFRTPVAEHIFMRNQFVVRLTGIVEVIHGHHQHPIDECIKMIIFLVV